MKLSVDRFEGGFAVCIDASGKKFHVLRELLPESTGEGSVLEKNADGYVLCPAEEAETRRNNFKKAQSLFDE